MMYEDKQSEQEAQNERIARKTEVLSMSKAYKMLQIKDRHEEITIRFVSSWLRDFLSRPSEIRKARNHDHLLKMSAEQFLKKMGVKMWPLKEEGRRHLTIQNQKGAAHKKDAMVYYVGPDTGPDPSGPGMRRRKRELTKRVTDFFKAVEREVLLS